MSLAEKYAEGKRRGKTWNAPWIPGGPWVMKPYHQSNKPGFLERCKQSAEECEAWLRGWRDGIRESHKESMVSGFAEYERSAT